MSQKRAENNSECLQKVSAADNDLTLVEVRDDTGKLVDNCDTDIPCDWEEDDDSEIDVLGTQDGVDEGEKPIHRRGAFDMDTILSTYFPCTRNTELNAASENDKFLCKPHEEVPVTHVPDSCCSNSG